MISIEVSDKSVLEALNQLALNSDDVTGQLDRIGASLADEVRLGFNDGADPYGNAWAQLSENSRSGQPLRDTRRLANSITHQVNGNELAVGTNVCYAAPHQTGAEIVAGAPPHQSLCGYQTKGSPYLSWIPRGGGKRSYAKKVKIPARPFLPTPDKGLPQAWNDNILQLMSDHILQGIES